MYRASQANIEQNFGRFAEQCATDVFAVPDALMQANDLAENLPSCSVEEEKALDDELRQLRRRLTHHVAVKNHCEDQCAKLEAEMADHAEVAAVLPARDPRRHRERAAPHRRPRRNGLAWSRPQSTAEAVSPVKVDRDVIQGPPVRRGEDSVCRPKEGRQRGEDP